MTLSEQSHNWPHSLLEPVHRAAEASSSVCYWQSKNCSRLGEGACEWQRLSFFLGDCGYQCAWRVWKVGHTFTLTRASSSVKCSDDKCGFCIIHWGLNLGSTIGKLHDLRHCLLETLPQLALSVKWLAVLSDVL